MEPISVDRIQSVLAEIQELRDRIWSWSDTYSVRIPRPPAHLTRFPVAIKSKSTRLGFVLRYIYLGHRGALNLHVEDERDNLHGLVLNSTDIQRFVSSIHESSYEPLYLWLRQVLKWMRDTESLVARSARERAAAAERHIRFVCGGGRSLRYWLWRIREWYHYHFVRLY